MTQIVDGERHTLHKVRFLLEVASKAISTEHLQSAEQHEVAQLSVKLIGIDRLIFAQGVDIVGYKLFAETIGEIGFRLPQERCYIVVERALSTALKIDKPRFAVLYHHIARLKIAIHKCVARRF